MIHQFLDERVVHAEMEEKHLEITSLLRCILHWLLDNVIVHVCGDDGDGDTTASILDNLADVFVLNTHNILAVHLDTLLIS